MDDEYYSLLGVPRTATPEEIKRAYKDIARKSHPDKGGDPEHFKKVNEAYGVLSDGTMRARYDQFGKSGQADIPFPDFFNMFPFHHAQTAPRRTPDRNMNLELTMEESFHGAPIRHCHKRKVFIGNAQSSSCGQCQGRGKVISQVRSPLGLLQQMSVCPACAGVGVSVAEKDFRVVPEVVSIQVPPGTGPGKQFIVRGKSDEMPNMETGDLVLTVTLKPHPVFQQDGHGGDIRWCIRTHPLEAITSFSRSVKLPSGEVVSIQCSSIDKFCSTLHQERILRGKGLYHADGRRGDLLISFSLEDFNTPHREDLFQLCQVPLPAQETTTGTPLHQIPTRQPQPQPQPQRHHPQPQVQECRPS